MAKQPQSEASKQLIREQIKSDTQTFLESGGEITVIPTGLSGVDFMKPGQKQIKLGNTNK